MRILLVSATELEIGPALSHFNSADYTQAINQNNITVLISGVGMTATAFSMGRALANQKYDLAVNAGIAGAFDYSLTIGEVVTVNQDCFAELGAEDGDNFLSIDTLGFGKANIQLIPSNHNNLLASCKTVRSITVNTAHGNTKSIDYIVSRLNPQTESMEGAAFFYACNEVNLPCIQLRAISNYVERRNRENWNIPLAVKNLNNTLIEFLNKLS